MTEVSFELKPQWKINHKHMEYHQSCGLKGYMNVEKKKPRSQVISNTEMAKISNLCLVMLWPSVSWFFICISCSDKL
ncbi:hypothetical protein AB3S75_001310 [Citrus x aurantiifolia]